MLFGLAGMTFFRLKSTLKGLGACWRGAGKPEHQETSKRPSTMKTHHCLAVLLGSTLLLAADPVQLKAEDSNWYFKGEAGPSFVNNITTTSTDLFGTTRTTKSSFKTGFRFDVDGGYQFNDSWALEAELGFIYNTVDFSNSAGTTSPAPYQLPFLVNGIYTLPLDWRVKPYVGAGLGLVVTGLNELGDVNGAGQLLAGVKYEVNERIDVGLGYKFLITTEHDWSSDVLGDTHSNRTLSHSILATVTVKF
jgi:opacity protein-like surface antigen